VSFAASPAQRAKVRELACLVCGVEPFQRKIDPAHLCARARGGCDQEACVIPLCRTCHRAFDEGRLGLLQHLRPYHATTRWRTEIVHSLDHYEWNVLGWLHRVTGEWHLPATNEREQEEAQRLSIYLETGGPLFA
jgi:hypothetical protein